MNVLLLKEMLLIQTALRKLNLFKIPLACMKTFPACRINADTTGCIIDTKVI